MKSKTEILLELGAAIDSGAVTRQDVDRLFDPLSEVKLDDVDNDKKVETGYFKRGLTIRSLFYAAGVIMFAAIVSVISQTWEGSLLLHIFLTVVLGVACWFFAYLVSRVDSSSDIRHGVGDTLILMGSLLLVAGGYIITNNFGEYGRVDFFEAIPALAIISVFHFIFYRYIKRDILYLVGMILAVASFGSLLYGILLDVNADLNVWALVLVGLAGLLSWSTHIVSRSFNTTKHLTSSHDKLAIVLSLLVMFSASLGDMAGVWYLSLVIFICCVYYLSVIKRQKILLGFASTFLVLTTLSVAFRYFSDFGLTASLLVSAAGILLVAAIATQLSKRYIDS